MLMYVDRMIVPIVSDVHAEIEEDTPEIMHPEPLLHLVFDLPIKALVSSDEEIINLQNDRGNDVLILIMEHEQSSVDM